jgi:hypothetical protein
MIELAAIESPLRGDTLVSLVYDLNNDGNSGNTLPVHHIVLQARRITSVRPIASGNDLTQPYRI